ncbi:PP2C family protein-serine/threonine phosphatase [Megalodesulfovibrio gigas]|uniref:histidine kinase n=1 Tax=Megalodesulfovibrio gigas (strain ATCC 19364 / DSM 1382 / NCIMB 9332 / VKM B-1759) TaxID=1121448 RepID=T2G8G1_MEGG1|nr:PAS domain S-box protein [Megalodesulfovibrio gigas]AGW12880.1 putative protein serine/threonine phosphatase with PAS/PAC(s) sensor [Megalodesulfovibrio gigas DSM 1382 = ATCC 19364]
MASDSSAPVPECLPPRQALSTESTGAEVLPLAKVIVEKSPAVLFRRLNDEAHRLVYVSENISRYGYAACEFLEGRREFADIVHPDDRDRLAAEIKEYARLERVEYTQEYRLVSPGGQVFWVHDETLAERDEQGRITHYQGIVMDITARRQAEDALRQANLIVERSPIILFRRTAGATGLEYVSQNVSRYGYDPEALRLGTLSFLDIVHPEDHASLVSQVRAARLAGKDEYAMRYRIRTATGELRWIDDVTTVDFDARGEPLHYQGVLADVTERVRAEEALRKSEEKHRRILETAAEGFIMMDAELRLVSCNEAYAAMLGYSPHELLGRRPHEWSTPEFRAFLVANRKRLLAQDRRSFEGSLVARDGTVVPVLVHGNTLRDPEGNFLNHIAFVTDISTQKKALALAEEVQRSLLPSGPPRWNGLEVAGRMAASESIGGDYYDYFDLPASYPGWLGVVVGDIAGHGVDAALLMTTARAFLRQRVQLPGELAEVMMDLNRALVRDMGDSGRFMTCFQLLINCCEHHPEALTRLCWVRAGHDPALLYDPETDCFTELDGPGLPLGIVEDYPFESRTLDSIRPGMVIAVGTDGIWEAMDTQGQLYGKERFKEVLRRHSRASAVDMVDAVFQDVGRFCQGVRFQDDVTLVIIKLVGAVPHA